MDNRNIKIISTGIYHPKNKVHNNFFIEHFNRLGIDCEHLMNKLGREVRYFAEGSEDNSLTMAIKASKDAIKTAKINETDLGMIIFISDTPEYTYPSNALKINHELGAKNAHLIFDMNSNCIGMLTAIDIASGYLKTHPNIKYSLITAGVMISSITRKDDPITYPNFSDGSAAIILKNEICHEKSGYIDASFFTDSNLHHTVTYPSMGFSNLYTNKTKLENTKLQFIPHDLSYISSIWENMIYELLKKNSIKLNDIDYYIFSQFNKLEIEETLTKLKVSLDKYNFVGYEYGYTGVTSPVFALNDAINTGKIKKDSTVIFCSVAIGFTMSVLLYKF